MRRFLAERQVLSDPAHPHIARLLGGGTEDEIPYRVMEYIDDLRSTGIAIGRGCR